MHDYYVHRHASSRLAELRAEADRARLATAVESGPPVPRLREWFLASRRAPAPPARTPVVCCA